MHLVTVGKRSIHYYYEVNKFQSRVIVGRAAVRPRGLGSPRHKRSVVKVMASVFRDRKAKKMKLPTQEKCTMQPC